MDQADLNSLVNNLKKKKTKNFCYAKFQKTHKRREISIMYCHTELSFNNYQLKVNPVSSLSPIHHLSIVTSGIGKFYQGAHAVWLSLFI